MAAGSCEAEESQAVPSADGLHWPLHGRLHGAGYSHFFSYIECIIITDKIEQVYLIQQDIQQEHLKENPVKGR